MSATTANDIIRASLRILQVLGDDVVLTANEANDALFALNTLLDSWSNDSETIYHVTKESFTLTANHNPHTYGIGGDFNSARPVKLLAAKVAVAGADQDLGIMSYNDYAEIANKTLTGTVPELAYYDCAYPTASVFLYPISTNTNVVTLFSEKPHPTADNLFSTLSFPPGFIQALRYNLAVQLAPEYQIKAGEDVVKIAVESLLLIKRNSRHLTTINPNIPSINTLPGA